MRASRPSSPLQVVGLLVITSLACSLAGGGRGQGETTVPTAATPGEEEVSPEATPETGFRSIEEEIFPEDEPPPPPQGMFDAMQERLLSGEWTLEQALITSLQLLAGEVTAEEAFGDRQPSTMEGFGTVVEARRYLRSGPDAAARAEIERLLTIVVPDVDRLLEYAEPASLARRGGPGLAAPASQQACIDLAQKGFPPGSPLKCFLYDEDPLGAWTVRVFYPQSWGSDQSKLEYALSALQAVHDSEFVYNDYGQIKDVDVIFTLLDSPALDLAEVTSEGGKDRCEVLIYPNALNQAEPQFMQTVAHEMFHCFQQWQFAAKFDHDWAVEDWWGEATAEYFSNVVYPKANDEWQRLSTFNANSAKRPLVEMSYENWVFFQFLANQVGNQGVLELINLMPASGGTAEQAQALSLFGNIETLFHQFGRDFVDKKIVDADKPTIVPTGWLTVPKEFRLSVGPGDHTVSLLTAPPFTLTRYGLTYAKERLYGITAQESGLPGLNGSRLVLGPPVWETPPTSVSAGCGDVKYYTLLTTTTTAGEAYTLAETADITQETKCDQCLIGTWDIDIESFAEYAEAPFIETPGMYEFGSAGGLWRYRFAATNTMAAEFDFFYTYRINQANEPLGNDITVDGALTIEGVGQGLYSTDGLSNLSFTNVSDNVAFSQEISMNGDKISEGPIENPGGYGYGAAAAVYSCDDEAGELLLNVAPTTGLPPILFNRVSTDPTKP